MDGSRFRPGHVLSQRWQLDGLLGRGAMGDVYRGLDLVLERPVAVKILAADYLGDKTMLARFRREAMASGRLAHPNVVTTLDFGVDGDAPYIVMELVRGTPLDRLLAECEPLDAVRAARLGRDIAEGLEAAHRQRIIHRDIKPSNVIVSRSAHGERARILDFGIARRAGAGPRLTMNGLGVGTPGYVAPEQLTGGEVGPRSDLFALGVTLYEMLSGELPWPETEAVAMLLAALHNPPRPLLQLRPDVPPALASLVAQMIQPLPEDRPRSAAEVAAQLRDFLANERRVAEGLRAAAPVGGPRSSALASASLRGDWGARLAQMEWFRAVVEAEGGVVAQSIGNEALALLPSAESSLRLTRTSVPGGVPRPALALHTGEVAFDSAGVALGAGVRVALRLARLASPQEVLITEELRDAVGLGWRGRLQPRGRFLLDSQLHCEVFSVHGAPVPAPPPERARLEEHPDGLHWRCPCSGRGRVPDNAGKAVRVRCSRCSRLLAFDLDPGGDRSAVAQEPAAPAHQEDPLSSIVLSRGGDDRSSEERVDDYLIASLSKTLA